MVSPDIVLIGCGNMGAALATGFLAAHPNGQVLAIDPDVTRALTLLPVNDRVSVQSHMDSLWEIRPGMTILAVKPQLAETVLPLLADQVATEGLVVSIVAGLSVARLRRYLPKSRIVRAMPNTPVMVDAGFSGLWGDGTVQPGDLARCEALFGAVGIARWVESENLIDAVTAVSGSGPAYFYAMIEAMTKAACSLGLTKNLADEIARATMAGASAMLRDPTAQPAALKQAVRSPNGTTDAALKVLEKGELLKSLMDNAINAAYDRAKVLGDE